MTFETQDHRTTLAGGDDAARVPAVSKAAVAADQGRAPRGVRNFLDVAINQFGFQSAWVVALPVAFVPWMLITLSSGAGVFRGIATAAATGDPLFAVVVALAAIYGLLASSTYSAIKAKVDEAARNAAEVAWRTDLETRRRETRVEDLAARRMAKEIGDQILSRLEGLEAVAATLMRSSPQTLSEPNTAEQWLLAPNSTYWAVNPQYRGDIVAKVSPGMTRQLVPDLERFRTAWLPRFSVATAIREAIYVLYVKDISSKDPADLESIRYTLTAFRTVKALAEADGSTVLLDRARFVIRSGSTPPMCFFVGERKRAGQRVAFSSWYLDAAHAFGLPRGLVDDRVEINFSRDWVEANLSNARHLAEGQPVYSLSELEAEFGHLAPDPVLDLPSQPSAARVSRRPRPGTDHWIANGDHLTFD